MEALTKIRDLYPEFKLIFAKHSIMLFINKDYPSFSQPLIGGDFNRAFMGLYERLINYKENFYNVE